ncbi:hypothetical protein AB0892_08575 [Streptomyces sp. NPDC005409]|uniref:hypothetical protein n=1 Tax=Streptomyces sp. NPDC005409 TaxID=3155342 RepID=UPI003451AFE5
MSFPRSRITPVMVALASGLAIGALGALAGKIPNPVFHVLSLVFSGGWSWACFGFLVGSFRQSKIESTWLASSALAIGVIAYYLLKDFTPVAPIGTPASGDPNGSNTSSGILVWGIAALVFGAPMGLFGNLAKTPGVGGLPFRLLVPLIAFFETYWRLDIEGSSAGSVAVITWSTIQVISVVAAVSLAGHTVWRWRYSARHTEGQA